MIGALLQLWLDMKLRDDLSRVLFRVNSLHLMLPLSHIVYSMNLVSV